MTAVGSKWFDIQSGVYTVDYLVHNFVTSSYTWTLLLKFDLMHLETWEKSADNHLDT